MEYESGVLSKNAIPLKSAKENEATNEFWWELGNESGGESNFMKISSVAGSFFFNM